jgi:hypothetical protein
MRYDCDVCGLQMPDPPAEVVATIQEARAEGVIVLIRHETCRESGKPSGYGGMERKGEGGRVTAFSPEEMLCAVCGDCGWIALGDGAICPTCGSDNTVGTGPYLV